MMGDDILLFSRMRVTSFSLPYMRTLYHRNLFPFPLPASTCADLQPLLRPGIFQEGQVPRVLVSREVLSSLHELPSHQPQIQGRNRFSRRSSAQLSSFYYRLRTDSEISCAFQSPVSLFLAYQISHAPLVNKEYL